ncbi:hypothetical protein [Actinomadura sp. 21ATH]|uniref:hypothetical protein n=1 Tax=Actinomadura sp. 21ATH TaxID=1735444 RepID=UPI0035BFB01F
MLRVVTAAVLSDVMSRKRQGPPSWGWVATYVLTCLDFLDESGATLDFEGPADLQGWYEHWKAMRHRLDRAPAFPAPAMPPPGAVPPESAADPAGESRQDGQHAAPADGPVSPAPVAPPGPPPDPPPPALTTRILRWQDLHDASLKDWLHRLRHQQSMAHRRLYELFGRHGADLLIAAEDGGREAACRLGILLLCHDRPNEARAWLKAAAEDGDAPADILLNAAPSRRREMAAELAYEFTLPGYAQDRPDEGTPTAAEVYYRAATAAGHMGATVRLGLIFEARGDLTSALHTFARAAARCHPDGLRHFERLNDQLTRSQDDSRPGDSH